MDSKTVSELRAIARECGLSGYSRLRKADLVKLLKQHIPPRGIVNFIDKENNFEGGSLLDEEFEFDAPILVPEKRKIQKKQSDLKNFAKQYTIDGATFSGDPKTFLLTVKPTILRFLNEHRNIKLEMILKCIMSKTNIATGEVEYTVGFFASNVEIALQGTDLDDLYRKAKIWFINRVDNVN